MEDSLDFQLMARAREGDETAFAEIIHRHQQPLANFFRRLGAFTDIEDLVQETFLRLYRYRMKFRPSAKFTTFLYTLARNAWFDSLRRRRTQERVAESVREDEPSARFSTLPRPAEHALDAEHVLSGLEERLREVVVLSVMQGLSYREAADVLGIPVGTVKSRMFEALHMLRRRFHEEA
jgi:RNA polymerase sigma-70 factor, ECF subfamily